MSLSTRPLIGINTDFHAATRSYSAHARLNVGYFDAVMQAGGLPVLLPPLGRETELDAILETLDGVMLTGGMDMDPRRFGQPAPTTIQPMSERRELSDRILIQRVMARRLPTLAIGLGMQQVNNMLGGTLHMHIPNDFIKPLPHFEPSGDPHRHVVSVEPKTLLEEIYGCSELRVNSRHHQCVKTIGAKLRVSARCPDGVIEAIESTDADWFCIGVQWHPEADTASALDMQLFECFLQATIRHSGRLQTPAPTSKKEAAMPRLRLVA